MEMHKHLPTVDPAKLELVVKIKEAYTQGDITLEQGHKMLLEQVGTLSPYEIALAEQTIKPFEEDECRKENIQHTLDLFSVVMDTSRPDLPEEHPIARYYQENDQMRKLLLSVEDLVQYPVIKNQWYEVYDQLAQFRIHLSRKQNQLYSILERKGFDRPTTTMWLLDDFVRDEIRNARRLLDEGTEEDFIAAQANIVADVRDLMSKEETVLYPTSLVMITAEEFEDMQAGDREIGYAWLEVATSIPSKTNPSPQANVSAPIGLVDELAALLGKYGVGAMSSQGLLDVTTGKLSLEQINLIYKHLPIDISFVDENELVCFYSDTDHRVFPRSKNVIGRDVKNCHPRTSVHLVEEIIAKFRSGEQDSVDFWINKPGLFIYIYYVAVRDEAGNFRGVLEMMQDCTRIRSLEGSRTLLTWSQDTKPNTAHDKPSSTSVDQASEPKTDLHAPNQLVSELEAGTKLKDLLATFPKLKEKLEDIHPAFGMLKTPLARMILPKATIQMMAERSGIPLEKLLESLKGLIAKL